LSITLIFLALLMGAVVWWLVKQTINVTPWVAHAATDSVREEGVRSPFNSRPLSNMKIGLGVFLAVATSLFALFISAYSIRMGYPDWRPLTEPSLLWINTGILVLSSVFLQWAWNGAKRNDLQTVWRGVAVGGASAIAFIVGQLAAWDQLASSGYFAIGNPANGFFYALTGAHALHLIGGLVALSRTVSRLWHHRDMESIKLGVELCAVYWHYLLVVWLILFGLLLTT
jgi:cytochrome c oxidase subunit III